MVSVHTEVEAMHTGGFQGASSVKAEALRQSSPSHSRLKRMKECEGGRKERDEAGESMEALDRST